MIVQIRLDERLLHGQVAARWTKSLNAEGIVCANDRVASDDFAKKMLMLAAPAKVKVIVKKVDDAIQTLKDPRADKMRIFVLVDNPRDLLKVAKELNIKEINIGNYSGNYNKDQTAERIELASTVKVTSDELEVIKEIAKLDANAFFQVLPEHEKKPVNDVLNGK